MVGADGGRGDRAGSGLGGYLRARRALVTPERAGLVAGGRRRVPGLRREEVALLAGISADYYLRLERGRDDNPSPQVLTSLARVLELDEVESEHLLGLTSARPRPRSQRRAERVPARLGHLLTALEVPAFIEGRCTDVLASNALARAFSPRLAPGQNRLRSLLLDPEERVFHEEWEQAVASFIAVFRRNVGQDVDDARAVELVGELSLASARFRTAWARQDVARLEGGTMRVHHPQLGPLVLHRDKLPLEGLTLVLYYADTGSESSEKLRLLSSLTSASGAPADVAPTPRPGDDD